MLLTLPNSRFPFRANPKFILLLLPAQFLCFLLIYHLPFRDATSWSSPLRKIGWHVGVGWGAEAPPSGILLPKWSGEDDPTKVGAIVAGVVDSQIVEWMEDFTSNWTIHITNVYNTTAHPVNKGHETMVYLNHILEHWDTLAPVTLFIHGHLESWHQDSPMNETVKSLNLEEVGKEGFINLRCNWEHGCPDRIYTTIDLDAGTIDVSSSEWEEYQVMQGVIEAFSRFFPNEPLPDVIASPCCAQFAVTREAIHRRDKEVYENMRNWLIHTGYNDHVSGTITERLWSYVLRGPDMDTVFCMTPQYCECRFYNKCTPPPAPFRYFKPVGTNPAKVRFLMGKPVVKGEENEIENGYDYGYGNKEDVVDWSPPPPPLPPGVNSNPNPNHMPLNSMPNPINSLNPISPPIDTVPSKYIYHPDTSTDNSLDTRPLFDVPDKKGANYHPELQNSALSNLKAGLIADHKAKLDPDASVEQG